MMKALTALKAGMNSDFSYLKEASIVLTTMSLNLTICSSNLARFSLCSRFIVIVFEKKYSS